MTTEPGLTRKVRQLDNDVQSIYEILARIELTQVRHGNRFTELDERLEGIEQHVSAHDARFDIIDARFDIIDARLESVEARLESVDVRLESMDGKLDHLIALGGGAPAT